jgi:uncharacterized protein (DUF4213/DUF364 family)
MPSVLAETFDNVIGKSHGTLERISVDDIVIGVFFTGVKLSTGHAGAAFTPVGEMPEAVCCPTSAARMPAAGSFGKTPVLEILPYALDRNVLKSAIGVATLNAVSQIILESEKPKEFSIVRDTDGFDLLQILPHETVSLVGAFGPYIRRLKMMGNRFFVIERNPRTLRPDEMKFFRSEADAGATLERSDVAILTGTAIVNQSIDSILHHLDSKKRAAIIGPTASMLPEAFFRRGVSVMAGVRITDPERMAIILRQGGSAFHLFKDSCEKTAFVRGANAEVDTKERNKVLLDLRRNKLLVTGRVTTPLELGMEELRSMETEEIADLGIICGEGDPKGRIRNCKGVLLEKILDMADVIKAEHNDTKKMFIVVSAHDGYKTVFSWQEIFNTAVGGGIMVLLERDGKPLDGERGELELISKEDYFTGSRYVRGLKDIEVVLVQ